MIDMFFFKGDEFISVGFESDEYPPAATRQWFDLLMVFHVLTARSERHKTLDTINLVRDLGSQAIQFVSQVFGMDALEFHSNFRKNLDLHGRLLEKYNEKWAELHPILDTLKRFGKLAPAVADDSYLRALET